MLLKFTTVVTGALLMEADLVNIPPFINPDMKKSHDPMILGESWCQSSSDGFTFSLLMHVLNSRWTLKFNKDTLISCFGTKIFSSSQQSGKHTIKSEWYLATLSDVTVINVK